MPQRVNVVQHPVLADRLTVLRDRSTPHGVFRQTVYHAHLHAIPLGATTFTAAIPGVSGDTGGIIVRQQADVRTWYAATGPYFYVEQATSDRSGSDSKVSTSVCGVNGPSCARRPAMNTRASM